MGRVIDYTKYRVGAGIKKCPKCGRNGRYSEHRKPNPKTGLKKWTTYHVSEYDASSGLPMEFVTDCCDGFTQ